MRLPDDILYTIDHLWIRTRGDGLVTVGMTDYAQQRVGRLVKVDLPEAGDPLIRDIDFGEVHSERAVADLISPVNGEAVAVNQALSAAPELVNEDPYDKGWLLVIRLHSGFPPGLMDAPGYEGQLGFIPFERTI